MIARMDLCRLLALLALCVALAGCASGGPPAGAPADKAQGEVEGVQQPEEASVPVKIVAYYPFNESHQYIADYLKELEAAHPGQVEVEIIDFRTPEGRTRWLETGLSCAGVFVNGSTRHEIARGEESETVDFLKRMDVFWAREDFETVVNQLLEGAAQPDEPAPEETEPEG